MKTYYYQGRIYQNRGESDSAMLCFVRGREFSTQAKDTLAIANLLVAQATIFYNTYNPDAAIKNNLEAAQLYKAIGYEDYEFLSIINVLECSIIGNNKQLADSMLYVARKKAGDNEEMNAYIMPLMLSFAENLGNRKEVLRILEKYETMQDLNGVIRIQMADAYSRIGDAVNARRWFESVDSASIQKYFLKYLATKPDVLEVQGDYAGALETYRRFSFIIDSIQNETFHQDLFFAEKRHEMEKANMMQIRKRDSIIWFSLCAVFVLLILSCLIYYRYRLNKAKIELDNKEKKRLELQNENLQKENENLELERHNALLEKQTAELERDRQMLAEENLRMKIRQLEDESASLKKILEKRRDIGAPVEDAIKVRIEMLNGLLATSITDDTSHSRLYEEWRDRILRDKDEFMNTTRLAFKASHPKFIGYLEEHGLTEAEINYVCLYALGLRGKEVGQYMQLKRHYNLSSAIRKKLGIDEHQTNIGIYIRKLMKI